MNEYRTAPPLHFSIFFPLPPSPTSLLSRISGLCLAMSLFLCLCYALSLSFPLSLSLILTRWVIAVALWLDWLMHSKSPGRWSTTNRRRREKKKSERQDWREKNERESESMSVCVCPSDRNPILKPLHQVVWFSEGGTLPLISESVLSFPV